MNRDGRVIGEPTGPREVARPDDRLRDAVLRTAMPGGDDVCGPFGSHKPLIYMRIFVLKTHGFCRRYCPSHSSESPAKWAQVASENNSVTSRSGFETRPAISLPYKDVMRSLRMAERDAVPARGGSSPLLSGGFGHHARRHYDRCVGCCHWTGTGDTG
jgi:hypothetical protein